VVNLHFAEFDQAVDKIAQAVFVEINLGVGVEHR
jgi:hypothetical protein